MTPREELLQYLADYPFHKPARRFPLRSNDGASADNSAELWAFIAGSMIGILMHSMFVWFTG